MQGSSFSCFCYPPLVGEAGLDACAGFLPSSTHLYLPTGEWSWVLSLWWAGLCQVVCLQAAVGSVRLSAACLIMGGAVFLPCWLFGLRHPRTGAYSLLSESRSWHQNGSLQKGSCQLVLPGTSATSVLVPTVSHSCSPHLPTRPFKTSR